jgi:hypothetical protein
MKELGVADENNSKPEQAPHPVGHCSFGIGRLWSVRRNNVSVQPKCALNHIPYNSPKTLQCGNRANGSSGAL